MRTISLFLLLTVGSLENSHGPFVRPERGGGHSVAAARSGVLMAWSENHSAGRARVHVARLDASGRTIAPIVVLPVLSGPERARSIHRHGWHVLPGGVGGSVRQAADGRHRRR